MGCPLKSGTRKIYHTGQKDQQQISETEKKAAAGTIFSKQNKKNDEKTSEKAYILSTWQPRLVNFLGFSDKSFGRLTHAINRHCQKPFT